MLRLRHLLRAQVFNNPGKVLRSRGQVEEPLAAQAFFLVDALQFGLQLGVILRLVEAQRKIANPADKVIQFGIAGVHAAEFNDASAHLRRELIAQRSPRHAHYGELIGQQPHLFQVEERGQQFASGQVARGAEDHQNPRLGNPLAARWDLGKILRAHAHLYRRHAVLPPAVVLLSLMLSTVSPMLSS